MLCSVVSYCFIKVWNISDYRKAGNLDKEGFFVALSLISLAQQNKRLGLDAVREKGTYHECVMIDTFLTPHSASSYVDGCTANETRI